MSSFESCNIVNVVRMFGSVFSSAYDGCRIAKVHCKETDQIAIPKWLVRLKVLPALAEFQTHYWVGWVLMSSPGVCLCVCAQHSVMSRSHQEQ